ncbi:MAG: bifunctional DNA primase/polymerase [Iamia sp.]
MTDTLAPPTIDTSTTLAEAAQIYAARGWPVFPLHDSAGGGCSCAEDCGKNAGKHPRTRHGFHDATTDPDQIRALWAETPTANIGIATGEASGVDVIDVDPDALHRVDEFDPGAGPRVKSPRGHHFYLAHQPGRRNSAGQVAPGVDVRAEGGYVVAPPSCVAGRAYRWASGRGPETEPVAVDLPAPAPAPAPLPASAPTVTGTPWGTSAAVDLLEELTDAPEGKRNATLFRVGRRLAEIVAGGDLDRTETVAALVSIAGAIGLGPDEITKTVRSAFDPAKVRPDAARVAASILDGLDEPEVQGDQEDEDSGAQGPGTGEGIRAANDMLGLPPDRRITHYTWEDSDQPRAVIHGPKGSGALTPLQLSRADAIRGAVKQATGRTVNKPRRGTWVEVVTALEEDEETIDMGDMASVAGRARNWITEYLHKRTVLDQHDPEAYGGWGPEPFHTEGGVAVYAEAVASWLISSRPDRIDRTDVVRGAQALGLERRAFKYVLGGRATTRSMYIVPEGSL